MELPTSAAPGDLPGYQKDLIRELDQLKAPPTISRFLTRYRFSETDCAAIRKGLASKLAAKRAAARRKEHREMVKRARARIRQPEPAGEIS